LAAVDLAEVLVVAEAAALVELALAVGFREAAVQAVLAEAASAATEVEHSVAAEVTEAVSVVEAIEGGLEAAIAPDNLVVEALDKEIAAENLVEAVEPRAQIEAISVAESAAAILLKTVLATALVEQHPIEAHSITFSGCHQTKGYTGWREADNP
jgi:hypothetical protein